MNFSGDVAPYSNLYGIILIDYERIGKDSSCSLCSKLTYLVPTASKFHDSK
jgi:hypothetical protein